MWVRGAAIRPVPPYAIVSRHVLDDIERKLAATAVDESADVDQAFARFEATQAALSRRAADVLSQSLDETALALGYFLIIAVWLGFDRMFGERLEEVTEAELEAAEAAITLEEEVRALHVDQPMELEDVMAIEQPAVLAFVNGHIEAALEPSEAHAGDVDVEDVQVVYRSVLVLTLALSRAVAPVHGARPHDLPV